MSNQENIVQFQVPTPAQQRDFATIGEVFIAWVQASKVTTDLQASKQTRNQASDRMQMLWEQATDMPTHAVHDVAAIFIMAQRTVTADANTFIETAWSLAHSQGGEAELAHHYDTWRKLDQAINALDMSDETVDGMGKIVADIEAKIAAIPATTARGLAIKVDVSRNHPKASQLAQSLAADLAALTGNDTRPI